MATIESNFESICINPNDDLVLYKKEIVRSRIEKFLYAICSLDTDDLPTPLSRIEELYNCLVTGEDIPTFTPLSRAEKFVMAMLGAYDVELLPTPISRSETLMKKIATGDNNLDDVDNLQSRYEFLLAYIIKDIDIAKPIQFVDYSLDNSWTTLYNTIDYPVKNTVLKGQTLVNCLDMSLVTTSEKASKSSDGTITIDNNTNYSRFNVYNNQTLIPPSSNNKFIMFFHNVVGDMSALSMDVNGLSINITDNRYIIFQTRTVDSSNRMFWVQKHRDKSATTDTVSFKVTILEYQEGMENWDIPYFEGMASVKMPVLTTTGKNLFDGELIDGYYDASFDNELIGDKTVYRSIKVYLKRGTYTLSFDQPVKLIREIKDGVYSHNGNDYLNYTFTTETDGLYGLSFRKADNTTFDLVNIQLEANSTATTYEPHKSNILTVNEEVTLRGIGEVKDELNLVTGELTQRFGEVVLNGSENWIRNSINDTTINCYCNGFGSKASSLVMCNKLKSERYDGIRTSTVGGFSITLDRNITGINDLNTFKNWLQNNNLTVVYPLEVETIKTVDLSTLNQDGKETKLNTFNDITHVTVSSEGLVPTGEITVATKNATDVSDASVMSLRMDDILNSQSTLEGSANTQSDDIDVAMLGMTDIYEQLL